MAALARTDLVAAATTPKVSHVSGLHAPGESFRRTLRAQNKSERTVETYGASAADERVREAHRWL